jgi:hypothetical protein
MLLDIAAFAEHNVARWISLLTTRGNLVNAARHMNTASLGLRYSCRMAASGSILDARLAGI